LPDGPEFIFIDESGDPGPEGNPLFLLAAVHMSNAVLEQVRFHLACFRYHHGVTKEFKDWGALLRDGVTVQLRSLLEFLCPLTAAGDITSTVNWVRKSSYTGPNPPVAGGSMRFRHFQLRLLLERHRQRRSWGAGLDIVLDRWSMSEEQRRNLERYLKQNWNLQPIHHLTAVDSGYCDEVQLADFYLRLARRVIEGEASDEHISLCSSLVDMKEVTGGRYP
jgi:hypothetical protein